MNLYFSGNTSASNWKRNRLTSRPALLSELKPKMKCINLLIVVVVLLYAAMHYNYINVVNNTHCPLYILSEVGIVNYAFIFVIYNVK